MKKDSFTKKQERELREQMAPALENIDLREWQKACESFGPFDYNRTTRKEWFEDNRHRVKTAQEIVSFVEEWKANLQEQEEFQNIKARPITEEIVDVIREAQEEEDIKSSKLNTFKLATFKTLLKFHKNPEKLEEGPYEGREKLPEGKKPKRKFRRGRKKEKGEYGPPLLDLVKDTQKKSKNLIVVVMGLTNAYLHPYQNVDIELELEEGLSVEGVKGFTWNEKESTIGIGFLEASLAVEPLEKEIAVDIKATKTGKHKIGAVVHYDDCDKGIRKKTKKTTRTIKV
ncbi:hypothetical protein EU545_04215 [Candidatus Thorarchaeota archaeon]|nr:MAG: hypothetical protein EU545_04215 [Candidatus Thorarchaeota archaeon]